MISRLKQKFETAHESLQDLKGKMKGLRKTNRAHVRHLQQLYAEQGTLR